jgi:hypothetical protein
MKRTSAFPATEWLDGSAVMPVIPASARAELPDFELAEIPLGATRPVPIIFRINMLPIEPVPMNPYCVMISLLYFNRIVKKEGGFSLPIKTESWSVPARSSRPVLYQLSSMPSVPAPGDDPLRSRVCQSKAGPAPPHYRDKPTGKKE